jgi:hypothetical protein
VTIMQTMEDLRLPADFEAGAYLVIPIAMRLPPTLGGTFRCTGAHRIPTHSLVLRGEPLDRPPGCGAMIVAM